MYIWKFALIEKSQIHVRKDLAEHPSQKALLREEHPVGETKVLYLCNMHQCKSAK